MYKTWTAKAWKYVWAARTQLLTRAFDAPWEPPSQSLSGLVHWKGNAVPVISSVWKREVASSYLWTEHYLYHAFNDYLYTIYYTSVIYF